MKSNKQWAVTCLYQKEDKLMKKKKFRKKGLFALLLLCLFIMSASVTVSAATNLLTSVKQAKEGTWKRDTQGRKYVYTDGRHPKSRWLKVKGKCYSFDAHGYVETGWKDYKGEIYYLSEVKGKEGQLLTGLQKVKGKTYYLSKTSGQLLHGWQMINGKRYYFGKKTGAMSKKKWIGSRYVSADGSVTKVKQTSKSRLIILGDCRVASMRDCRIGNAIYIGKVSMGYNWLRSTAGPMLESYLASYPESTVVFGFGLNDYLYQQANYLTYYRSFIASHPRANIYLMSINPVIGVGAYNVSNATIRPFNDALRNNFPDNYLDCFSHLQKVGYYAADGQHYNTATYRKIYDYIVKATGWVS